MAFPFFPLYQQRNVIPCKQLRQYSTPSGAVVSTAASRFDSSVSYGPAPRIEIQNANF